MTAKILTSLHGRKLGLDHEGRLVAPKGIIIGGQDGAQSSIPGAIEPVLFDDFFNFANGATQPWMDVQGSDGGTAAGILAGGHGGILRLTTGAAGSGLAADSVQLQQRVLSWTTARGGLNVEARIRMSAITTMYAFFGLTDTVANALEAPIVSAASDNDLTGTADDAVGFMYDTRMDDDNWWVVSHNDGTTLQGQDTGIAPAPTVWETLRVAVDADGHASFYRNGVQVAHKINDAVDPDAPLTVVLTVSKLSVAAAMTLDADYIQASSSR
jgi:hypothetical protein